MSPPRACCGMARACCGLGVVCAARAWGGRLGASCTGGLALTPRLARALWIVCRFSRAVDVASRHLLAPAGCCARV